MFLEDSSELTSLSHGLIFCSQKAAIDSFYAIGRGDKSFADKCAVDSLRRTLNSLKMSASIVSTEGRVDRAPMFDEEETLGKGGVKFDIAIDPIEGTTYMANGLSGAFTIVACGLPNSIMRTPELYAKKIAIGSDYPKGTVSLDRSLRENVISLAKAKGVDSREITVCMLNRERHSNFIEEVRSLGCKVQLIEHGDILGCLSVFDCLPFRGSFCDIFYGIGGSTEGVISAVIIKALRGQYEMQFNPSNREEKELLERFRIFDSSEIFSLDGLITDDAVCVLTGITDSILLDGVRKEKCFFVTHSLAVSTVSNSFSFIKSNFSREYLDKI